MASNDRHPLHIPDSLTAYRMKDDSEERGGEEKWNPEERVNVDTPFDGSRNPVSKAGNDFKGGGLGAVDALETQMQFEAADPEMMQLMYEYNNRPKGDDRSFDQWLEGEDFDPSTVKAEKSDYLKGGERHFKPGGIVIDLSTKEAQHDTGVSLALEALGPVWGDEKTVAYYIFGEPGKPDLIAFRNEELEGDHKGGAVAIEVAKFNKVLEASEIKMRLRRPRHGDVNGVQGILSRLRLGKKGSRYGGEEVKIIYPDKPKKEAKQEPEKQAPKDRAESLKPMRDLYNLTIDGKGLDRMTKGVTGPGEAEAKANRDAVADFMYYMTSEQESVKELVFLTDSVDGSEATAVKSVVLKVMDRPKGGTQDQAVEKTIIIPVGVFNRAITGNEAYHKFGKSQNEVVGVKFKTIKADGKPWEGYIHPKTNEQNLMGVVDKIRFEGKPLESDHIKVFIGVMENGEIVPKHAPEDVQIGETKVVTQERGPWEPEPYPQTRVNPHPGSDKI